MKTFEQLRQESIDHFDIAERKQTLFSLALDNARTEASTVLTERAAGYSGNLCERLIADTEANVFDSHRLLQQASGNAQHLEQHDPEIARLKAKLYGTPLQPTNAKHDDAIDGEFHEITPEKSTGISSPDGKPVDLFNTDDTPHF
jgi:hypothetical protein